MLVEIMQKFKIHQLDTDDHMLLTSGLITNLCILLADGSNIFKTNILVQCSASAVHAYDHTEI